jgi:hypothetical protein
MTNTLIDNTEALKMTAKLQECIATPDVKEIMIATGFWDIPGLALLANDLRSFLEREGSSIRLLIGTDPVVRAGYLKNPIYKDAKFPQDFIRIQTQNLEVKDEYVDAVKFLLDYCDEDEEKSKIKYDNPQYGLSKSQSFVVYSMLKISDVTDSGRQ